MQPQEPEELFSFETVRVNSRGEIVHRETKQAYRYRQNLSPEVDLEMVSIPTGSFLMGSPDGEGNDAEKPQHLVNVPAFYLGKYPIAQKQYLAVMGDNPSNFKGDDLPVENVSWWNAQRFCDRLNQKTGKKYRLPSEAEWEYACRAGTTTPFHFGETITIDLANVSASLQETMPVGIYRVANDFGLSDLHGNVWEWCLDEWSDNYQNYQGAPTDGSARGDFNSRDNHSGRILRGGSFNLYPGNCRSAGRNWWPAVRRGKYVGFRVLHPQDF
jgi:formylglycine-generating enzyme required for sulfatase activity